MNDIIIVPTLKKARVRCTKSCTKIYLQKNHFDRMKKRKKNLKKIAL